MNREWAEKFLDGHLHLVWFVNDVLKWAVKNLAIYDATEEWNIDGVFYLINPIFLASGIIDRRETVLQAHKAVRVVGSATPPLLAGEEVEK